MNFRKFGNRHRSPSPPNFPRSPRPSSAKRLYMSIVNGARQRKYIVVVLALFLAFAYFSRQQFATSLDSIHEKYQELLLTQQRNVSDAIAAANRERAKDYQHQQMPPQVPLPVAPAQSVWQCEDCLEGDKICDKYGSWSIARSRTNVGSGTRVRKVIEKALRGEPIKIGVIGGSVSTGHGLPTENGKYPETHNRNTWAQQVFQWFRTTFPDADHSIVDASQPATGLDYFSFCFKEHLPTDVDIVFLEAAINDQRFLFDTVLKRTETILRGLLALPNEPAIVFAEVFALIFEAIGSAGEQHVNAARHFDVGMISAKDIFLPHVLQHTKATQDIFSKVNDHEWDLRHFGEVGHTALADMIKSYFNLELCKVKRKLAGKDSKVGLKVNKMFPQASEMTVVPRLGLTDPWSDDAVIPPLKPMCKSLKSPNPESRLVPIGGTKGKTPTGDMGSGKGWYEWQSSPEKKYYIAKDHWARITFEIPETALGHIVVHYLRSKTYGLGDAWCWVTPPETKDTDKDWHKLQSKGKRLYGYWTWEANIPVAESIQERGPPGKYHLHCETLPENGEADADGRRDRSEFRISAVMAA